MYKAASFTKELTRLSNTIFVHNHPAGGLFSLADLYVACVSEVLTMTVVTDLSLYSIKSLYAGQHSTPVHHADIARCFTIRAEYFRLPGG